MQRYVSVNAVFNFNFMHFLLGKRGMGRVKEETRLVKYDSLLAFSPLTNNQTQQFALYAQAVDMCTASPPDRNLSCGKEVHSFHLTC